MANNNLFGLKFTTKELTLIPIFTALSAVLAQIIIPLPFTPVPLSLATLSVFLAGGLLGAKNGTASQLVYILLGVIGVPVFAGLAGGLGIVTGPTGGYIVGYAAAAWIIGVLKKKLPQKMWAYIIAMAIGAVTYYFLGTAWFMNLTNTGLVVSLTMCVIPFIPGDILKIILAAFLVNRLSKYVGI